MTTRKFNHRGFWLRRLATALAAVSVQPSPAAEPAPIKIAVFDFELKDASAGGGIIAQDAIDTENLKKSTEQVAPCFRIRVASASSTPALSR